MCSWNLKKNIIFSLSFYLIMFYDWIIYTNAKKNLIALFFFAFVYCQEKRLVIERQFWIIESYYLIFITFEGKFSKHIIKFNKKNNVFSLSFENRAYRIKFENFNDWMKHIIIACKKSNININEINRRMSQWKYMFDFISLI